MESVDITNLYVQRGDSDVATSRNYRVASSLSWSKSVCNPKMGIARIEGPQRLLPHYCLLSKMNTLNGCGLASMQSPPPKASPWVPTWLVESI